MLKFFFKWVLRLFLLAVVLVVIFFLSLDTILRLITENRIRAQTGMEAEIGKFHLGLLEPVIEIKDLRLYNPANFGGTPFLNIPEIHVEYDRPRWPGTSNPHHAPALQSRRTGHREKRSGPDEPVRIGRDAARRKKTSPKASRSTHSKGRPAWISKALTC